MLCKEPLLLSFVGKSLLHINLPAQPTLAAKTVIMHQPFMSFFLLISADNVVAVIVTSEYFLTPANSALPRHYFHASSVEPALGIWLARVIEKRRSSVKCATRPPSRVSEAKSVQMENRKESQVKVKSKELARWEIKCAQHREDILILIPGHVFWIYLCIAQVLHCKKGGSRDWRRRRLKHRPDCEFQNERLEISIGFSLGSVDFVKLLGNYLSVGGRLKSKR